MSAPLDELYLRWLYEQIGNVNLKTKSRTYWSLLRQLYTKQFVWLIPNDDNRVEDGRDLRYEFVDSHEIEAVDQDWMSLECSMLEMLIALSRRLAFDAEEGQPHEWFWELLKNLGMSEYNDKIYDSEIEEEVDDKLDNVIWRTYFPDGIGGLFPLQNPHQDQRWVELWYQLNAYLMERF